MAVDRLTHRCPRCGGEMYRYLDPRTDDAWIACLEPDCDYARPDEEE